MAKRFTDTDKWKKNNFGELSMKMKLTQLYLWDQCDHAGVWDINMGLLKFQIGEAVTIEEIQATFKDKVEVVDNDKLFMQSFIDFQYGELNLLNKVHKSVIDRLTKLNVKSKPLVSPLEGAKDKDTDTDKEMDKAKETDTAKSVQISPEVVRNLFDELVGGKGKILKTPGHFFPPILLEDFKLITGYPKFREVETWHEYFNMVASSNWLLNDFNVTFAWLLKPDNAFKVLSGSYQDKPFTEKATRQARVDCGAKSDQLFERIIRDGRYQFKKEDYSAIEMEAIRSGGGLAAIFDCTDFSKEKVKAQLRAAYKQASEELS